MTASTFLFFFLSAFLLYCIYTSFLMRRDYAAAVNYEACVPPDAASYHSARRSLRELASMAGLPAPVLVFGEHVGGLNISLIACSKRRGVIKVSTPLAQAFSEQQWRGSLGHELGHMQQGTFFANSFLARGVWFSMRAAAMCTIVSLGIEIIFAAVNSTIGFLTFVRYIIACATFSLVSIFAIDCLYSFYLRRGEFNADRFSVELTGEKGGLLSVLCSVEKEEKKSRRTLHIRELELLEQCGAYCVRIFRCAVFLRSLLRTHPDTRERIRRIEALGGR